MLEKLGDIYAFVFGWPGMVRLNRGLFYLSARGMGLNNYRSLAGSGELRVIQGMIGRARTPVIFDVGANEGSWAAAALQANSLAQIHAFEPQAELAARIAAACPTITVNRVAVGETSGELDLHDYMDHPGSKHASLLKGVIDAIHGGIPRLTKVPVITLDEYCRRHRVEHIHFLKIDVEGFELSVLRGSKQLITAGRIETIQFEFNEMHAIARTFLTDFMDCLGDSFSLHRILPHGTLPLKNNSHWFNEQFTFQNLLAVRKDTRLG